MATSVVTDPFENHEEGEIIDDDSDSLDKPETPSWKFAEPDLEDVSDCSLDLEDVGFKEQNYLSGISDTDLGSAEIIDLTKMDDHLEEFQYRYKRKKRLIKRHFKPLDIFVKPLYRNHIPRISDLDDSDSSSSDDSDRRELQRKLSRAVARTVTKSSNLQVRLGKMVNSNSHLKPDEKITEMTEDELDLQTLRELALQSKHTLNVPMNKPSEETVQTDDILDEEMHQLRLEALKSSILRKFDVLKKKKENYKNKRRCDFDSFSSDELETYAQKELPKERSCDGVTKITDDDDRTSSVEPPLAQIDEIDGCESVQMKVESIDDNIDENEIAKSIKVDSSRDSSPEEDEDILRALVLSSMAKKITDQSEKSEQSPQRLVINVENDTESDSEKEQIDSFQARLSELLKTAREEVAQQQKQEYKHTKAKVAKKIDVKPTIAKTTSNFSNKTHLIKNLPISKQVEYLNLQRHLFLVNQQKSRKLILNAINNPNLVKKINFETIKTDKIVNRINEKTKLAKEDDAKRVPLQSTNNVTAMNKQVDIASKKLPQTKPISYQTNLSQKAIGNLSEIVKKTKVARLARDEAATEVRMLIEKLKLAKLKYINYHQHFKNCVHEYVKQKAVYDNQAAILSNHQNSDLSGNKTAAATVMKKKRLLSTSLTNQKSDNQNASVNSNKKLKQVNVASISSVNDNTTCKQISSNAEAVMPAGVDDQVPSNGVPMENVRVKRESIDNDPLVEMCPYDLQGTCRDEDCKYRHIIS